MIKEAVIGLFSGAPNPTVADRYYLRIHGPEVVNVSGPWMRRYVSFRAYEPPPEAVERFGARRGRYTELWFSSIEEYLSRPDAMASFTPAHWIKERPETGQTGEAHTMVPALPTEDFLGKWPRAEETTILRWCCAIRYPAGVSVEDGEKWYLEVHSQEAKQQPGLLRYISFRCLEIPNPTPEELTPEEPRPGGAPWIRISELWYENFDAWRRAVIDSPPEYTPPPWGGEYPFVDMLSNFIDHKPDIDFLSGNYTIP